MEAVQVDQIVDALEEASTRKERLQKAFTELDNHRAIVADFTFNWKELEQHFADIESVVKRRVDELKEKEQALEAKSEELQQVLNKRKDVVSEREQASLARVQEQKDSAIAAIFEEKRKWTEEKQILKAKGFDVIADEKSAFAGDAANTISIDTREVVAAANSSAAQAMDVESSPIKSADAGGCNEAASNGITDDKDHGVAVSELKVRPQLKSLCEDLDGDGVRKYLVKHRKDMGALRTEMPSALQFAIDPARLVLRALEGYLPEHDGSQEKEIGASAVRRACILLLESLNVLLADPLLGEDHTVVPSSIKESAKEMADKWKSKMDFQADAAVGNSLDAQAFLQLLATFGIASEYDTDELCNLVITIARCKQTPTLCKSLGLTARIPDIVDKLSKEGKAIEALAFAHIFGIMDKIQPVSLLKGYLKEARKIAHSISKNGNNSPAAQNDSTMKELSALKAVLKCIEEYKLEAQYTSAPLQRRLAQLEKAKSDRKRAAVAVKAQAKRPRGIGAAGGSSVSVSSDRGLLRASERGQYTATGLSSYGLSSPSTYDRRLPANYAATFAGVRSPVSLSSSYPYSTDGLGSQFYGSSVYSNPSATYSSYQFGSSLPPPPPAYQSSFFH
ncbi:hypothetical protein O6H91_23G002100 [Diphasiastrum complanatum]|uniref:Uncharacterized protein n=1 Tax=Diphasiastrum complanatum TaxID=34168 RepID=A0ACC2A7R0_DIPCM|nr:hypothetical protein O6H91_Y116900 [Diphasiastrum complanatum]KAJ7513496.1 hypothetical protein O6H91_23G002100 [Diphasiastrum complanatum]